MRTHRLTPALLLVGAAIVSPVQGQSRTTGEIQPPPAPTVSAQAKETQEGPTIIGGCNALGCLAPQVTAGAKVASGAEPTTAPPQIPLPQISPGPKGEQSGSTVIGGCATSGCVAPEVTAGPKGRSGSDPSATPPQVPLPRPAPGPKGEQTAPTMLPNSMGLIPGLQVPGVKVPGASSAPAITLPPAPPQPSTPKRGGGPGGT